ncbi:HTH-type transcriptional regulator DmlR [Zhongshania aliphaticivorans]|uniref:HTH-type transcriptional regulator DmlR n=1 Tax=Zhongshania aliphaticivorans TaxID=1470434 RepID=A0A5S9QHJ6_9GAMM|nr:LysR family transcriptional regulator [Zhongshania aliphaticivorans]CAA0110533.1 HTH-type transcriptional regulator DmlR [Zhongshania aliphaticivorans]CAA0118169.1 HTH-type transcriptional regulator DmlR [Zhongshania aliphaticivorans]CAA0122179.1 HTH-type transcriptional regulator DmlR [Zhongshania aliphaticivorans]
MTSANDIALFGLLVEAGSFTKAAEMAQMSPPGLSKRIAKLEEDINAQLVYRSTRRLSLTDAGQRLWIHAQRINQQLDDALAEVSEYNSEPKGLVRVSVPTISGDILLADVISEFCQLYPGIQVDLRLENRFVDLIAEGVDIAVRTGELKDSNLKAKLLVYSDWVVCASPAYLDKHNNIESPLDLSEHNCLIYSLQQGGGNNWSFRNAEGASTIVTVSGTLASNNAVVLKRACMAGYGITYVPKCLVHSEIKAGSLVSLWHELSAKRQGVYAVSPYNRVQSLPVRTLIAFIDKAYKSREFWFLKSL